jgi:micrococcal nuclease
MKKNLNKKNLQIILLLFISLILILSLLLFSKHPNNKEEISINEDSFVLRVIDGDTFELLNGEKVRLICVDAPERGERGYENARLFLSSLISNKEVILIEDLDNRDKYHRLLRYVYVNNSQGELTFVNKELIKENHAKIFRYGNSTALCDEIENISNNS